MWQSFAGTSKAAVCLSFLSGINSDVTVLLLSICEGPLLNPQVFLECRETGMVLEEAMKERQLLLCKVHPVRYRSGGLGKKVTKWKGRMTCLAKQESTNPPGNKQHSQVSGGHCQLCRERKSKRCA